MTSFLSSVPSSDKYENQDAKYPGSFLELLTRNKPVRFKIQEANGKKCNRYLVVCGKCFRRSYSCTNNSYYYKSSVRGK